MNAKKQDNLKSDNDKINIDIWHEMVKQYTPSRRLKSYGPNVYFVSLVSNKCIFLKKTPTWYLQCPFVLQKSWCHWSQPLIAEQCLGLLLIPLSPVHVSFWLYLYC